MISLFVALSVLLSGATHTASTSTDRRIDRLPPAGHQDPNTCPINNVHC